MFSRRTRIGAILARITNTDGSNYCIDFTEHVNIDDDDDVRDEWQWSYPIYFTYEYNHRAGGMVFLNQRDVPYGTRERYTCRVFWKDQSTTIVKMLQDTMIIRRARMDMVPRWSVQAMCTAADRVWDQRMD